MGANPALFSVVTFPFIFGMMYGDVGHGFLLFLAGCFLCYKGEALRYTFAEGFAARFLILQLGFYATFAGLMYNDMFSVGLPIFKTRFDCSTVNCEPTYDITNEGGPGPYPFGIDPSWHGSTNECFS